MNHPKLLWRGSSDSEYLLNSYTRAQLDSYKYMDYVWSAFDEKHYSKALSNLSKGDLCYIKVKCSDDNLEYIYLCYYLSFTSSTEGGKINTHNLYYYLNTNLYQRQEVSSPYALTGQLVNKLDPKDSSAFKNLNLDHSGDNYNLYKFNNTNTNIADLSKILYIKKDSATYQSNYQIWNYRVPTASQTNEPIKGIEKGTCPSSFSFKKHYSRDSSHSFKTSYLGQFSYKIKRSDTTEGYVRLSYVDTGYIKLGTDEKGTKISYIKIQVNKDEKSENGIALHAYQNYTGMVYANENCTQTTMGGCWKSYPLFWSLGYTPTTITALLCGAGGGGGGGDFKEGSGILSNNSIWSGGGGGGGAILPCILNFKYTYKFYIKLGQAGLGGAAAVAKVFSKDIPAKAGDDGESSFINSTSFDYCTSDYGFVLNGGKGGQPGLQDRDKGVTAAGGAGGSLVNTGNNTERITLLPSNTYICKGGNGGQGGKHILTDYISATKGYDIAKISMSVFDSTNDDSYIAQINGGSILSDSVNTSGGGGGASVGEGASATSSTNKDIIYYGLAGGGGKGATQKNQGGNGGAGILILTY